MNLTSLAVPMSSLALFPVLPAASSSSITMPTTYGVGAKRTQIVRPLTAASPVRALPAAAEGLDEGLVAEFAEFAADTLEWSNITIEAALEAWSQE